ncbi:MAG: IS1595 family transposase [Rhodospirillaceae bacterium]|nr:IS1595 family transposase [Rhodospirillaceae bacterium]
MTLAQLFRKFPDDETAEKWFADQRWGDTPACPHCGSTNVLSGAKHPNQPYRCREKQCGKRFSVKVGTPMQDSNVGYQTWAIALYLLVTNLKGVSSMKLHRDLGITQKTAWHLAHRMREGFAVTLIGKQMSGLVEVDESYFGGLEKNKHKSRRLNAGHGPVGKTPVAGMKDRVSNQIAAKAVPETKKSTLQKHLAEHVPPDVTVFSDESYAYEGLLNLESVKHSIGEYVRGQVHINGMESFWSMMKRGYHGTYHKMSPKHLDRCVGEFSGRYNIR